MAAPAYVDANFVWFPSGTDANRLTAEHSDLEVVASTTLVVTIDIALTDALMTDHTWLSAWTGSHIQFWEIRDQGLLRAYFYDSSNTLRTFTADQSLQAAGIADNTRTRLRMSLSGIDTTTWTVQWSYSTNDTDWTVIGTAQDVTAVAGMHVGVYDTWAITEGGAGASDELSLYGYTVYADGERVVEMVPANFVSDAASVITDNTGVSWTVLRAGAEQTTIVVAPALVDSRTDLTTLTALLADNFSEDIIASRMRQVVVSSHPESAQGHFPPLATAPSSPFTGQSYLDTTLNELRLWDGSVWKSFSGDSDPPPPPPGNWNHLLGESYYGNPVQGALAGNNHLTVDPDGIQWRSWVAPKTGNIDRIHGWQRVGGNDPNDAYTTCTYSRGNGGVYRYYIKAADGVGGIPGTVLGWGDVVGHPDGAPANCHEFPVVNVNSHSYPSYLNNGYIVSAMHFEAIVPVSTTGGHTSPGSVPVVAGTKYYTVIENVSTEYGGATTDYCSTNDFLCAWYPTEPDLHQGTPLTADDFVLYEAGSPEGRYFPYGGVVYDDDYMHGSLAQTAFLTERTYTDTTLFRQPFSPNQNITLDQLNFRVSKGTTGTDALRIRYVNTATEEELLSTTIAYASIDAPFTQYSGSWHNSRWVQLDHADLAFAANGSYAIEFSSAGATTTYRIPTFYHSSRYTAFRPTYGFFPTPAILSTNSGTSWSNAGTAFTAMSFYCRIV